MPKAIFSMVLIFPGAGCAKLAHLQELLTLKELSDERDQQVLYVAQQDKNFEKLLAAIQDHSIVQFTDQKNFLQTFGKPVLTKRIEREGKPLQQWLYRYLTKPFGSPKVYLYFDASGKLLDWEYLKRDADKENV